MIAAIRIHNAYAFSIGTGIEGIAATDKAAFRQEAVMVIRMPANVCV